AVGSARPRRRAQPAPGRRGGRAWLPARVGNRLPYRAGRARRWRLDRGARVNSPGGYIYVLYGEDAFGRDEAVQTLKERMRALAAGDHNLSDLGPETSVATLRMHADVVPFLSDRRMVIVRGLLGRLAGRGGGARRSARSRKAAETAPDEFQALLDYVPD